MTLALGATHTVSVGKATKCPLRKWRAKRSKRPSSWGLGIGKLATHQQREGLDKVGETVKIEDKCEAGKIDNFPNNEVWFSEWRKIRMEIAKSCRRKTRLFTKELRRKLNKTMQFRKGCSSDSKELHKIFSKTWWCLQAFDCAFHVEPPLCIMNHEAKFLPSSSTVQPGYPPNRAIAAWTGFQIKRRSKDHRGLR